MKRVFSEKFMQFVESIKMTDSDMDILQKIDGEELQAIADVLHLAKVQAKIFVRETDSSEKIVPQKMVQVFCEEKIDPEYFIDIAYDRLDSERGMVRLFPWKGYKWSEDEMRLVQMVVKVITLLVSRSSLYSYLSDLNMWDLMTGIPNAVGLRRRCYKLKEQNRLLEYTAIMLNLKGFKYINKRYGMSFGDLLLKKYAIVLDQMVKGRGYAARFGGDYFFVAVKTVHAEDVIQKLLCTEIEVKMEEILSGSDNLNVQKTESYMSTIVEVCARLGVYHATEVDDPPSFISNASVALELSKRKNQDYSICTQGLLQHIFEGKKLLGLFPKAMEDREIVPYYQPKVNIMTGKLYGCEALVRWFRDGKMISPGMFLPALEREGLTQQLDLYMLDAVCRDLRRWMDEKIEPVKVSVNYSRLDLKNSNLVTTTQKILERYGIDGKFIEIEITETADLEDMYAMENFINKMHALGITISMDDFGTGYSSMNVFRRLDFDVVKLDKSFIDNIETQVKKDEVIMKNMIRMLGELDVEVIAEGVETKRQIDFLLPTNCNVVQGYFFDKPLSFEEYSARLKQRSYLN